MSDEKPVVKFKYSKSGDYRLIPANGAHGGITPRGDFRIDFFIESWDLPEEVHNSLTPDGLGPEIGRLPEKQKISREAQVGIILSLPQIKDLAGWILKQISDFEELIKKEKG